MSAWQRFMTGLAALLVGGAALLAQSERPPAAKNESGENSAGNTDRTPAKTITPEREAAAMTFARLHHRELADLLGHLQRHSRPEFRRAVRDLYETSERLARLQERFPERHELALHEWKLDSQIRLLLARMTMSDDPALEPQLHSLVEQRIEIRVRQMKQERDRLATRLGRVEDRIAEIETNREAVVLREVQRARRSVSGKAATRRE